MRFLTGKIERTLDIPTGLGKTAVMAIWLVALAWHARNGNGVSFPRRLVYVVNRRTVVDQATAEAEKLRKALIEDVQLQDVKKLLCSLAAYTDDDPVVVSTLRGQFADKGEWRTDPARPAIVVGTVDMIGSRLLFSGYGRGFKSKPLHAGFLGQDVLIVHDEAHLESAFQSLLESIEMEQKSCQEKRPQSDQRAIRVMALTATTRSVGDPASDDASDATLFGKEDENHPEAGKRLRAKKWLAFHPVEDEKKLPAQIVELAEKLKDSGQAVLIFIRALEHVEHAVRELRKKRLQVQTLTGTLRGWERDQLVKEDEIFARFLPSAETPSAPKTVYLVCTSAGEVGVNISADHMVCDLTPFDSMAQRLGRVNRFGRGEAQIEVVYASGSKKPESGSEALTAQGDSDATLDFTETPDSDEIKASEVHGKKRKDGSPYDIACHKTLEVLHKLNPAGTDSEGRKRHDASPAALRTLPQDERLAAFTPAPIVLPVTDILLDAWALTTIRGRLPGRPPVAGWLHGIQGWEPPETHVAWREEVDLITGSLLERYAPADLLDDYPLKPHELLRDRTGRIFKHLRSIAERNPDLPVWIVEADDNVQALKLAELMERNERQLAECIVILPPKAGGLRNGLLDGGATFDSETRYDVADEWGHENGRYRRRRMWDDESAPAGMRLVLRIDIAPDKEDEDEAPQDRYWSWYVLPRAADDDGSRSARQAQTLGVHLQWVESRAATLVKRLGLEDKIARAVVLAARWHDLGKKRRVWQRSIGNRGNVILAKSGPSMKPVDITKYRHEFGSLLDVRDDPEFQGLDPEMQELVLHLIAAHHGRARPHFPEDEAFDPERPTKETQEMARIVPQRFARLQRQYGRWGLAWLESLVRAADAMASQAIPAAVSTASDQDVNATAEEKV